MFSFSLPSISKYFFIILCSIYTYAKINNLRFSKRSYSLASLFSLVFAPLTCYIKTSFPSYTLLIIICLIILFCGMFFRHPIPQTLCLSILSVGSTYVLFILFMLITSPITYLLFSQKLSEQVIVSIILPLIGILQNIFIALLFHTKRLRNGMPYITNKLLNSNLIYVGTLLILFSSFFFLNTPPSLALDQLLVSFVLALGVISWLDWQKSIQADYINKNNSQQIDLLETKLQERDAELERLSKIIHKDNKLLAALELSTREVLQDASNEKAESLLQELNRFSKERSETLHAYEAGRASLPNSGLFSVDTMLNYLYQRALKHKIDFQLNLEGELSGITSYISEEDLCTIIADLGENAIIATKDAETKNILLSIKQQDTNYILSFYDSGEPFAAEVLENLGKKRYTTHAETGGSGIGLMTTSELAQKYNATFTISSTDMTPPYTKQVSFVLNTGKES